MKRHAVFVDAGYVFAQGSVSLLGAKSDRSFLKLDEEIIIRQLKALALGKGPGVQLLRIYWYDGARNGPTVDHLALANMQDVKLRLGSINSSGQQKEVDSLLVTDLIELARNQSICDATLVASDSDIRIAVQIAQSFGVRVHLVGLEPSRVSQSPALRQEVDTVHEISKASISEFLKLTISPEPAVAEIVLAPPLTSSAGVPVVAPASAIETNTTRGGVAISLGQALEEAIQRTLSPVRPEDFPRLRSALSAGNMVPKEYDGKLLGICRSLLGRDLTGDERRQMRAEFIRRTVDLNSQTNNS